MATVTRVTATLIYYLPLMVSRAETFGGAAPSFKSVVNSLLRNGCSFGDWCFASRHPFAGVSAGPESSASCPHGSHEEQSAAEPQGPAKIGRDELFEEDDHEPGRCPEGQDRSHPQKGSENVRTSGSMLFFLRSRYPLIVLAIAPAVVTMVAGSTGTLSVS